MTCERWKEVDLIDFVESDQATVFRPFQLHLDVCAACRAEVDTWREMSRLLRQERADHPSPAALVRWVEAEGVLGEDASRVAAHVRVCRACAEEARTLRSFDFTAIVPASSARRPAHDPATPGLWPRLRARLGDLGMRPVYGLALAGIAAIVLARGLESESPRGTVRPAPPESAPVEIARVETPPAPAERNAAPEEPPEQRDTMAVDHVPPEQIAPRPAFTAPPAENAERAAPVVSAPAERSTTPRTQPSSRRPAARERDARPVPSPDEAVAVARSEPPRAAEPSADDAAGSVLDKFLAQRKEEPGDSQQGAAGGSAVTRATGDGAGPGSSAVGFDRPRRGEASDDGAWRVVVLEEARPVAVTGVTKGIRLRVRAPRGSAPDAAVQVTVVSPEGKRWTGEASARPGSAWREITLDGERVREAGVHSVVVASLGEDGEAQTYDATLEVR